MCVCVNACAGAAGTVPLFLTANPTHNTQHCLPSYGFFAGRDATRGYVTGDFKGDLVSDLSGLTNRQLLEVVQWEEFYRDEGKYTFQGYLSGYYYDEHGKPAAGLERLEAGVAEAKQEKAVADAEKKKYPACSSRWTQKEGGHVWCEEQDQGGSEKEGEGSGAGEYVRATRFPRQLFMESTKGYRCACTTLAEAESLSGRIELYAGCKPDAKRCKSA